MSRLYFLRGKQPLRLVDPRSPFLIFCLLLSICFAFPATAKDVSHYGDGFSIDLDESYDRVLQVVKNTLEDGIVRGTSEYKGVAELYGAVPATASNAFHTPPAPGVVMYKVRTNTIAPDHFYQSNDVGVVTVRYVVKALGPQSTRLSIDAIFQEDSHHHYHPSDGTVENAEFLAISDEIRDLDEKEAREKRDAAYAVEEKKIADLLSQLDAARAELKASTAKEQELASKVHAVSSGKPAQIRTASADLKSEPHNQSRTLGLLSHGEAVTVLLETRSWDRVQAANGQQGWVYRLMLEVPQ